MPKVNKSTALPDSVTDQELYIQSKTLTKEEKAKQEDYNKRQKGFLDGLTKLENKYKIRLKMASHIVYHDDKLYE
jgi:hypothetical protein